MPQKLTFKLLPSEAADAAIVKKYIAASAAVAIPDIYGYHIIKHSIDARGRQAWVHR